MEEIGTARDELKYSVKGRRRQSAVRHIRCKRNEKQLCESEPYAILAF